MPRARIQQISAPATITPRATPVNTFVSPARPAPSPLHELADGLSSLDKGLSSFMDKRKADQDKADKIRGEAAFHKNNSVGYAEAVKQGLIPANASPNFVRAYKNQQGNLSGLKLSDSFNAAYNQWEGRNSDDPEVFQQFLTDFISGAVGTDDPDILEGLNPHLGNLAQSAFSHHSNERATATYNDAVSTNGAVSGEAIDQASDLGLSTREGTDYDGLWEQLTIQRQQATGSGILESDYDKTLVDAITAKAIEHGDPQLLELLDRNIPGDDHALSSYPEFRDAKQNALGELERVNNARMIADDKAQAKQDKARKDEIVRAANQALVRDPNAQVPEDVMKEWEKLDPNARSKFMELRKNLIEGAAAEDPREMLELHRDIREGAGVEDVEQAVRDGVIRSHSEYTRAIQTVEKYKEIRKNGGGILKVRNTERFRKAIHSRTDNSKDIVASIFGLGGLSDEGLGAIQKLELMLMEWEQNNPDASQLERLKTINEVGALILSKLPDHEQASDHSQDVNAYLNDVPPKLAALSSERQIFVQEEARRLGISAEVDVSSIILSLKSIMQP